MLSSNWIPLQNVEKDSWREAGKVRIAGERQVR